MSHLIITQGENEGQELVVPAGGFKYGRSPVNDIVLQGSSVMLFHGRFFFKSDGALWVTDFGAANKTLVGGVPVDEHPLKKGDLVTVGETIFLVQQTQLAEEADALVDLPVSDEPAVVEQEIDLGFKGHKKRDHSAGTKKEGAPKSSLVNRIVHVLVVLLVLVVLGVVGPSLYKMIQPERSAPVKKKDRLTLSYERVIGDSKNVFRYYLEIDEKGTFSIQIDDLKNNRHTSKSEEIGEAALLQLASALEDSAFFDTDPGVSGDVPGVYNLCDIAVYMKGRFHHVRQMNRTLPKQLQRTLVVIEEFAEKELNIPITWRYTGEELMELAEDAVALAETRYAERDVRYENLATAINLYEDSLFNMETMEPKPPLFQRASDGLKRAIEEQSARYEDYEFRVDKAMRLKDWRTAEKYLRIILELIPDRSDERHERANGQLLKIEQRLR